MPARKALTPLLIAAALFAAGCGGGEVAYEEVNLPPPTLTVPKDSGATPTTADADETPTPSPTPTTTPDASGGTTSGGTTSGGTTAPGTTAPSTGGTTEDTGGATTQTQTQPEDTGGASPDEGLDQFCADNPGACDGEG